jgi:UDP-N-acetyl-D-galactosamine dehydrogenase
MDKNLTICIIGMGYVGLPLAIEFGKFFNVIGYDIDKEKIKKLKLGIDDTKEVSSKQFRLSKFLKFSHEDISLAEAKHFIITVPTPVKKNNIPDLKYLKSASRVVGKYIKKGSCIVYESTVYPGATEEVCLPILENNTSLRYNRDFFLGYSPERINPGDTKYKLTNITKIISASSPKALITINKLYSTIIKAGTYKTSSIKVAEAAKVIENTQRDLNIALMNELSIIFNKIGIETKEVLQAASTKWNFANYSPGLVGGHCIGVDPYYLTYIAKKYNYDPKIILSGRKLNNSMSSYIVQALISEQRKKKISPSKSRVLVLGLTFKEDCPDTRNSKVLNLIQDLKSKVAYIDAYDPWIEENIIEGATILKRINFQKKYESIIIAVGHKAFIKMGIKKIKSLLTENSVLFDVKGIFSKKDSDLRL